MKAALCETLDGPDAVVVRDVDDPGDPGTVRSAWPSALAASPLPMS